MASDKLLCEVISSLLISVCIYEERAMDAEQGINDAVKTGRYPFERKKPLDEKAALKEIVAQQDHLYNTDKNVKAAVDLLATLNPTGALVSKVIGDWGRRTM